MKLKAFFCTLLCSFFIAASAAQTDSIDSPSISKARLNVIEINGKLIENFSPEKTSYLQYLPYTTTKTPNIKVAVYDTKAKYKISTAKNINGNSDERSATITVTSGDKSTKQTYTVVFEVLPKLDIFFCIGQSNMAGRGKLQPEDFEPIANTYLFTPGNNWEVATNPLNKYSNIRKEMKMQQMGPSYAFAKKVSSTIDHPIALVVNALGGSNIKNWIKGPDGKLYESSLKRIKEAQQWGTVKAILWHQGESNSGSGTVTKYPEQLKTMVADFRRELGDENLLFVAGELAYWRSGGNGSTAFNEMINTIASFIPHSACVSAEGLNMLKDEKDPHFGRDGQLILGERYADIVLKMIYNK